MATFNFETITAAQAQTFTANDRLVFLTGTAVQSSVAYLTNGDIVITSGGHSLEFNFSISFVQQPFRFQADGSSLWIGNTDRDLVSFGGVGPPNAAFGGGADDSLDLGTLGGLAQGNQGDDDLHSAGQATIYGGQGDDTISTTAGAHDDFLQANKGDDLIQAGGAHDTALGGQGNDTIVGVGGIDFLNGNLGNDSVSGHGQLFGEDGNDTLVGSPVGSNTISGGNGNDLIQDQGGTGSLVHNQLSGDDGNDTISSSSDLGSTILGGVGNDSITTMAGGHDSIDGGVGNDRIEILGVFGGGSAFVQGNEGNDVIIDDSNGPNVIDCGDGDDTVLSFNFQSETISGGVGNDTIYADRDGTKVVDGGDGDDVVEFGAGHSTGTGGAGADFLIDIGGQNSLSGGDGDDHLAGSGFDTLNGGDGADLLEARGGHESLSGGAGVDTFVMSSTFVTLQNGQMDAILDWSHEDHIQVSGLSPNSMHYSETTAPDLATAISSSTGFGFNSLSVVAVQVGADVVVFCEPGNASPQAVTLVGRSLADIDASNFI